MDVGAHGVEEGRGKAHNMPHNQLSHPLVLPLQCRPCWQVSGRLLVLQCGTTVQHGPPGMTCTMEDMIFDYDMLAPS